MTIWDRLRKRPEPLPHQQIVALSGVLYRDHMAAMELEPGEPGVWFETLKLLDRVAATPEALEQWYGPTVDTLLLERGIVTDDTSRQRLIQETDRAFRQVFRALPPGPVFYSLAPVRGKPADPVERAQSAGAKVGQWVREVVGITDPNVQPNHAWRHRFKTVAREVGIAPEYSDAITGHEDGRAASDYGETTVKALWREVQKLPRYEVSAKRM